MGRSTAFPTRAGRPLACLVAALALTTLAAGADAPTDLPPPRVAAPALPPALPVPGASLLALGREDAVRQSLLHNPGLATARAGIGIAAAGVVIARQYPFNPIYTNRVMAAGGPADAGITNRVFNEHTVQVEVELRGQAGHRVSAATAALSRAEWDVVSQEAGVGVSALRAFDTLVYRRDKLRVLEETVRLNEETVRRVRRLVELGTVRPGDLILARTEVDAARAVIGQGRTALAVARSDLRRSLGRLDDFFDVRGALDVPPAPADPAALLEAAVAHRPDVQSRRAAVAEAEARLRLDRANRFGNVLIGPAIEYNETRVFFAGAALTAPLPVLNTRRGELLQREAELQRARQELAQFEVQAGQDVQAALARLADARSWVEGYEKEVLPNLARSREQLEKLFNQGEPGVDVLKLIDVQRKYLRAYDSALDARYEVSQALADLAGAVGDPCLTLTPPTAPEADPAVKPAERAP